MCSQVHTLPSKFLTLTIQPPFLLPPQTNFQIPTAVYHYATQHCLLIINALCSGYQHSTATHTVLIFCFLQAKWLHDSSPQISAFCILLYVLLFLCRILYKVVVKTKDPQARYPSSRLICPLGYYLTSPCLSFPIYKQ